jgi:hypothetical protein
MSNITPINLDTTGSWALNTAARTALKTGGETLQVNYKGQIYQMNLASKKIHLALINQSLNQ